MPPWRTLIQRLEPWAMFVSVLGIVFWTHKGVFWGVLFVVGLIKVARAWKEASTPFSHETVQDLLGALGFLGAVVALYFTLHAFWPALVHRDPGLSFQSVYPLVLPEGAPPGELRVEPEDGDWRVTFGAAKDGILVQGASGTLLRCDVIRAAAEGYVRPLALHQLSGDLAIGESRAWIQLDSDGSPKNVRLDKSVSSRAQNYFSGNVRTP